MIEAKLRALTFLQENRPLQIFLIGNAMDLDPDGRGRFLVHPRSLEYDKFDKCAMLVVPLNKFQLCDEDAWDYVSESDLDAIQQPDSMPDELCELIL